MDSVVASSHNDQFIPGFQFENIPYEILPRYPLEPERGSFIFPQEMNPDIIEGPPNNMDDEVGAINTRLLDKVYIVLFSKFRREVSTFNNR